MPDNNKHKLFSKEELFKLIDEKKSLPPDADDFDKEAMEGLSMLSDRKKLDKLDNSIDEVLRKESAKAKKKKNLYILSAAAAVILIVGFFFLLKDISFDKKENVLAENTTGASKDQSEIKTTDEKTVADKTVAEEKLKEESAAAETVSKEKQPVSPGAVSQGNGNLSGGDAMAAPPTEVASAIQEKTANKKVANEESESSAKSVGGKDYKSTLAKSDQSPREESKKLEDKEKDNTRYITNTVWTAPPSSGAGISVDESKNKTKDYRSKDQDDGDANSVAGNISTATPQKSAEVAVYEKEKSNSPAKKIRTKNEIAKPDTIVAEMLAGYSYNELKPDRGLVQGGAPQAAAPVQTQTESSVAFSQAADVSNEQKVAQDVVDKKSGKHETQLDNMQSTEPKSAAEGVSSGEGAEFVGGKEAMQQYVKRNLKISSPAKSGKIEAEFEVKSDGKVDPNSVKITKKIKDCNPCSDDVKELVKTMPKWKPASEKGKAVNRKQRISVDYNAK